MEQYPPLDLSPQSDLEKFRRYLKENGFFIENEAMILDEGKFYTVIKAGFGTNEKDACVCKTLPEYRFGAVLIKRRDAVLKQYLLKEEKKSGRDLKRICRKERGRADGRTGSCLQGFKKKNFHVSGRHKMKCSEVIEILGKLAPESCACDWDNPGLLAGRSDKEVKKIYIALDATDQVVDAAIKAGADMLLTHHPLIF